MYPLNAFIQFTLYYILSLFTLTIYPFNPPSRHTLSIHPPTHPINPPSQPTLPPTLLTQGGGSVFNLGHNAAGGLNPPHGQGKAQGQGLAPANLPGQLPDRDWQKRLGAMKFSIESDESSDDDRPSGGARRGGGGGGGSGSGDLETVELYSKYSPQQQLHGKPRTAPPGGGGGSSSSGSHPNNHPVRKDKDKASKGSHSHGKGFNPQQMLAASIPGLGGGGGGPRGGGDVRGGSGSASKPSKVLTLTHPMIMCRRAYHMSAYQKQTHLIMT